MRRIRIIFILLLFIGIFCSPKFSGSNLVIAGEWFDSYESKISWNDERAHLINFAYTLEKDSNLIGYIGFYTGEKDKPKRLKSRINRAKQYLVTSLKIDKNRIVIIDAGKRYEKSLIVLQPTLKNYPPPNF